MLEDVELALVPPFAPHLSWSLSIRTGGFGSMMPPQTAAAVAAAASREFHFREDLESPVRCV